MLRSPQYSLASLLVAIVAAPAFAAGELAFDFKDPKGVNAMTFVLDSPLEPIVGTAAGISGVIKFDPAEPKKLSGSILVDAKSLQTTNERMTQVLHSTDWIDVEKHPTIEFKIREVKEARSPRENTFALKVLGDFTCHGQTQEMTIDVIAHHLPGHMSKRMRGMEGDLLVLRTEFSVLRSAFKINLEQSTQIVSDEIRIRASIVGGAPQAQ